VSDAFQPDQSPAARFRSVPGRLSDQVRATVDRALDRVFDEPFDIRSADDFVRLMVDPPDSGRPGTAAGALAAFVAIAAPLTERGLRLVRASGRAPIPAARAAKYAAVAVPVGVQLSATVRRGVRELQVLASYIVRRFREQGIVPNRGLVRSLTVSLALDPERRPDVSVEPRRAAARLARTWIFRAVGTDTEHAVRDRAHAQLAALERIDLRDLATS
jgi:hypothetical protein